MIKWVGAYVGTALAMGVVDAIWLTTMTDRFYKPVIGPIMKAKPDMGAAIIFYLLYVGGIVFFAVAPALREESWSRALINGAVLGLIAYGTYDLTNQATLQAWQSKLTIVDMAWGTFITAASGTTGYLAARWVEGRWG